MMATTLEDILVAAMRVAQRESREEMLAAVERALGRVRPSSDDDLMDTGEAAAFGKVHEETIRRLVKKGVLIRRGHGRLIRLRRSEVRAYFESHHDNGKPVLTPEAAAAAFMARKQRQ